MAMTISRFASCSTVVAVLAAVLLAGPAAAQTPPGAASEAPPPAAKARITKRDCRRVLRHQPSGDVAYKPGVDARGKAVAPADLSGGFKMVLPDVFEFNVTKDLTAYLGGAEDQLAADKAAALAAEKSAAATDAAVSSATQSLAAAQTTYDNAAAAAEAATTAAAAAPNDAALAETAATALSARETVAKSAGMELNVGTVRFNINTGAMTFNGQPLNDAATGELAVICKEILSGK